MNGLMQTRSLTREIAGPVPATLVRGIDLDFAPGEFVAITGASGSGKSSLLYLLGLLDRPTSGQVLMDGKNTAALSSAERSRLRLARIGFVFQFHFLLPEFSALENVMIPMHKLADRSAAARLDRARELLDRLGVLDQAEKTPDRMSGGQRQRVAIARALANDPPFVLADEPTGNLDSKNARLVFEIFARLAHEQGRTAIVVTHEANLAGIADRRIHLADGKVVSDAVASQAVAESN